MPKSSKKRKEKAADFSKAKLKLGKGKQLPNNAVDTSFKARSIALPTQSITINKDTVTHTTRKKLTFDDLVSHLKHYNAGTRKDAILGLRELLETYSSLIPQLLTSIINSCVRLMSDEDASVRKSLLSFFQWLLPRISAEQLSPHSPVILLFTTSAQTHIFPEIRLDAVRFLDLFLEFIPQIVVEGWSEPGSTHGKRVLDGYFGLLNAGSKFGEGGDNGPVQATSTASVVLSAASKLVVLSSLSAFLRQATSTSSSCPPPSNSSNHSPTWYMVPSFVTPEAYNAFNSILQVPRSPGCSTSTHKQWKQECDFAEDTFTGRFPLALDVDEPIITLQDLSDVVHTVSGPSDSKISGPAERPDGAYISHVSHTLHPILISTFLDCAPSVFSPGSHPPETEIQLVTTLAEICRTLYNVILQGKAPDENSRECDDLKIILGYMSPYFPFHVHAGSTRRDIKVEQTIQDLNLIFCELTSLLVLASFEPISKTSKGKLPATNRGKRVPKALITSLPVSRVSQYVVELLRGESASSNGLSRYISVSAYTALLPTIWSLINNTGYQEVASDVLIATIDHAIKISSASAVKRSTIEFIGRLILLRTEPQYSGPLKTNGNREVEVKLEDWMVQLPKTLWELGANNPSTTEVILRLLLRLCQRKAWTTKSITSVCSRLIPYFVVSHPTRGELPGPFCKLPAACRKLVLDLVSTINSLPNVQLGNLKVAVNTALPTAEDRDYWTQVLC